MPQTKSLHNHQWLLCGWQFTAARVVNTQALPRGRLAPSIQRWVTANICFPEPVRRQLLGAGHILLLKGSQWVAIFRRQRGKQPVSQTSMMSDSKVKITIIYKRHCPDIGSQLVLQEGGEGQGLKGGSGHKTPASPHSHCAVFSCL